MAQIMTKQTIIEDTTSLEQVEQLVRRAGQMILDAQVTASQIHEKEGLGNYVTDYDVRIQQFLINGIKAVFPDAAFYGEETTEGNRTRDVKEGLVVYIDPIDGTTNFMFRYHHSCVSVGVAFGGEMIAGFVYNPYVDEMYRAVRTLGAYLNGERLRVKDRALAEGLAAVGYARYNDAYVDAMFRIEKELFLNSIAIRNGGSAALDLCRVASGSNVSYLELLLQPYDYAAASVIIEEAGGAISQVNGEAITLDRGCSIVGGTRKAVDEVRTIVRKHLPEN